MAVRVHLLRGLQQVGHFVVDIVRHLSDEVVDDALRLRVVDIDFPFPRLVSPWLVLLRLVDLGQVTGVETSRELCSTTWAASSSVMSSLLAV
jgi:hypothetical protein